ncbi:diphthine synthase [Geoglobus acetivorans]|uniref:Diphthine synthase n=1 Tax=Geoglobus acetivorans TaxID=565033 RepID=A0A0A7GF56_GEOAI|nr:Diphthine synthase [Geoglobus acetivorans]
MPLTFVGLGLCDERDITLKGLEAVRNADRVYVEFYTSRLSTSLETLERTFGREIELLERRHLEEESAKLIDEARERVVVVLVPGDPMIATTHSSVVFEAKKKGVEVRIIHNASIVSAIAGVTGLHIYRFGKIATVSYPYRNTVSRTPLDVIKQNLSINAHTLLLLDLNPEPMTIEYAVELLERIDDGTLDHFAVGVARVGSDDSLAVCDKFYRLRDHDFGKPLHSIVVLARTIHITEYEFLREFANAPASLESLVE